MSPMNFHSLPVPPGCLQQSSMGISAPENNGCYLQNILLEQVCNLLPPIPFTSQDDHLSLQCEARDRPCLQRLISNRIPLSNSNAFPVLYLSKYRAHQFDPTSTTKPVHPPVPHKGVQLGPMPAATIPPVSSTSQMVHKWMGQGMSLVAYILLDQVCNTIPPLPPHMTAYTSRQYSIPNQTWQEQNALPVLSKLDPHQTPR